MNYYVNTTISTGSDPCSPDVCDNPGRGGRPRFDCLDPSRLHGTAEESLCGVGMVKQIVQNKEIGDK